MKPRAMTIAQMLRRKAAQEAQAKKAAVEPKILSLDEEIARLEREIDSDSDSSDSDSYSSSGSSKGDNADRSGADGRKRAKRRSRSSGDDEQSDSEGEETFDDADGLLENHGGVISSLKPDERIVPLPKKYLPDSHCKFADKAGQKDRPKPKRFRIADALTEASVASGLERTIAEQLKNYEPVSMDKKPFFCRVCKFQGDSLEQLEAHKQSDSHVKAVELERKLSSCSLCKKQFTSPEQLKGHLEGKAHKEKLERAKGFQQIRR